MAQTTRLASFGPIVVVRPLVVVVVGGCDAVVDTCGCRRVEMVVVVVLLLPLLLLLLMLMLLMLMLLLLWWWWWLAESSQSKFLFVK